MVEWNILGNLCEIGTGSNNREDACDNGLYPFFVRSRQVHIILEIFLAIILLKWEIS